MNIMNRKKNRAFLILLGVLFMLATSGCTNDNGKTGDMNPIETNSSEQATSEVKSVDPSETKTADTTVTKEADGNETKEFVTIKWVYPNAPQKDDAIVEKAIAEYLKDKINADVDLMPIEWGTWPDKRNMMIAASEEFDIMWTASWNGFFENVTKNAFVDITPYWDTLLAGTKEALHPLFVNGSMVEGKSYSIPCNKEVGMADALLFRKDVFENLGIQKESLKTLNDFDKLFAKVKEMYPDMVPNFLGKKGYMYSPYIIAEKIAGWGFPVISDENLKAYNLYEDPRAVEWLQYLHKWYEAGYINEDAPTNSSTSTEGNKNEAVFSIFGVAHPGKSGEFELQSGRKWDMIAFTPAVADANTIFGSMQAISTTSKNVERSLQFLDLFNTDQFLNGLVNFGIEDIHYVKVSDQVIKRPEGVNVADIGYNPAATWMFGAQMLNYVFDFESPDKWVQYNAFNETCIPSYTYGFTFNQDSVKTEVAACQNTLEEFEASLGTGAVDPTEYLKKLNDKLYANGLQKIIDECQAQIDVWKATQ